MTQEIKIYETMLGKTFTKVYRENCMNIHRWSDYHKKYFPHVVNSDVIVFENDEETFYFYHDYECCESVDIDDIVGELSLLENSPLLVAEEFTQCPDMPGLDSITYTFYKFATVKGHVDIKWYGESNGFYSESVDFSHYVKELPL